MERGSECAGIPDKTSRSSPEFVATHLKSLPFPGPNLGFLDPHTSVNEQIQGPHPSDEGRGM